MGGLMILSGLTVGTVLWANPLNPYVWIVLAVTLGFGFVGFYDDYLKVTKQTTTGFGSKLRLLDRGGHRAGRLLCAGAAEPRSRLDRADDSLPQGHRAAFRLVLRRVRRLRHRRRRQRGEPHRRSRRPCHRARDDRDRELCDDRLSRRQRGVRRLSADQICRRHRRTRGALRRAARRRSRLPLVQRAAGLDLHGRHRLARARRHARRDRGRGEARDRARGDRRPVRAGGGFRHRAGGCRSSSPASASSGWRRSITISSSSAGPNRRS